MSEFHSRHGKGEPEEVALTPEQQRALLGGLGSLQAPQTDARFNRQLLDALFSGRDLRPWYAQAATRLQWMAVPLVIGFVLTPPLARRWLAFEFPPQPAPGVSAAATSHTPSAPPLPPLPPDLIAATVAPMGAPRTQPSGGAVRSVVRATHNRHNVLYGSTVHANVRPAMQEEARHAAR